MAHSPITAPYPPCGACLACKNCESILKGGGRASPWQWKQLCGRECIGILTNHCTWSSSSKRAERGPVEVTRVSAENPGFVGCTEISYLMRTQLVAELDEVLSAVQPICRHGCLTSQDGQPGQRTCRFALPEPALLPKGHCGAEVVVYAWEYRRYCFKLDGRELVLTCCCLFAVCGI